jgi:hypothetical protein
MKCPLIVVLSYLTQCARPARAVHNRLEQANTALSIPCSGNDIAQGLCLGGYARIATQRKTIERCVSGGMGEAINSPRVVKLGSWKAGVAGDALKRE